MTATAEPPGESEKNALVDISALLADLGLRLDEAAGFYDSASSLADGRLGCMQALAAVIDFCDRLGWSSDRRSHLFQLFKALQTADAGTMDPLLAVEHRDGGKARPITEMQQRGYVAAAVESLIRDGIDLESASKWVALRVKKMRAASRVRTNLWKAVRGWRIAASSGNIHENPDAVVFRAACEQFDLGVKPGKAAAEKLLADARKLGQMQNALGSN